TARYGEGPGGRDRQHACKRAAGPGGRSVHSQAGRAADSPRAEGQRRGRPRDVEVRRAAVDGDPGSTVEAGPADVGRPVSKGDGAVAGRGRGATDVVGAAVEDQLR